jgi:hypothetical protein
MPNDIAELDIDFSSVDEILGGGDLSELKKSKTEITSNLENLSLDDLASQYQEIDRQSNLLKGKILLEARRRFPSDKEFGQWVSSQTLCLGNQKTINRLMHLAEFFNHEDDMEGITLTAAYEISSPSNRETATKVIKKIQGKNLPVKEVKQLLISSRKVTDKKTTEKVIKEEKKIHDKPNEETQKIAVNKINEVLQGKTNKFKLDVLKAAIQLVKEN